MKYLFLLLVVLLQTQLMNAQTEIKPLHSFSLNDCVAFAQKNNVQVKNSLLAIEVQVQTNREIAAAAYPTIGTNVGGTDFLKIPTSI